MLNSARLRSHILTVLCLSPVHPPGAVLEARLATLGVGGKIDWKFGLGAQHSSGCTPFGKYAECYVDSGTAAAVPPVVLSHKARAQANDTLSSLRRPSLERQVAYYASFPPSIYSSSVSSSLSWHLAAVSGIIYGLHLQCTGIRIGQRGTLALDYHESHYYFATDADDPSTNAGQKDLSSQIDNKEPTLLSGIHPEHLSLPLSIPEPSIVNSSVPSMQSDMSSGVSTFSATIFDVSYLDGTKRMIATVVLGSTSGSNVFELLGIFVKTETTCDSAQDPEFETESDIDTKDSTAHSQRVAHDKMSNAPVCASKKDSLSSSLKAAELIGTLRKDHFIFAAPAGETEMHWYMSFFSAQTTVPCPTLVRRPLALRPRRKTQRGCRGKGAKFKKAKIPKKVTLRLITTPSELEAHIKPVSTGNSSLGGEYTVSPSLSVYERPLANSSLRSLVSDTSSTASTVSLITVNSPYSEGAETAVVSGISCFIWEDRIDALLLDLQLDVEDGSSTADAGSFVSVTTKERPSFAQKITEFVQKYRMARSTNGFTTVGTTLEEVSDVSRPRRKTRRGTKHRGKGGRGKNAAGSSAEGCSDSATASAGISSLRI
ncbi:hypothetical protein EW145_g5793 [Phellinidium pouzarii]|uniref:Uncharacterized protein n=1 Tax=Phellinidium pouzarii TaxID=167371 RepID=A0A4S4KYX0_9AGAM|nr:hypothetical protein EW145_g5793 [Phellinidium pouzarii]